MKDFKTRNIEEISIGDYILSGGESAFVIIDSSFETFTWRYRQLKNQKR